MFPQKYRPRLLNLGCGDTFHSDWVNMDVSSAHPGVITYDLRLGIPFADDSFDVIYHSHVLEHLEHPYAEHLLRECFRALKPGGLLRVAVPDLENIARAYLAALDEARTGDSAAQERHQWMLVELLDQLCRTQSGGEMLRWWAKNPMPQEGFILSRMGAEMQGALARLRSNPPAPEKRTPLPAADPSFAQSGEAHRWMYDELSLAFLLKEAGFGRVERRAHNASSRPDILTYNLDTLEGGAPRKPDSFFMEAVKPECEADPPLRAVLLCAYDQGGAGSAALRLHQALRSLADTGGKKVSSQFYCASQKSTAQAVHLMPSPGQRILRAADGRADLAGFHVSNRRCAEALKAWPRRAPDSEMFSPAEHCVDLAKTPLFEDFGIINLHWVSRMCDPSFAAEALRGRPVVWTLHDMNPFTGGCHYSAGCTRFTGQCGSCPELGSDDPKDISFETWRKRMGVYRLLDLHIVCPSAWLADMAKQSSLLRRFPVRVIPNAHPLDIFRPLDRTAIRASLGFAPEELVLLFAAESLDNKRKGGEYLLAALRGLAALPLAARTRLLLLGSSPPEDFLRTGLCADATGLVNTPERMARLYNAADAVLVPSLEDNSPNVICEALGCGAPVVAFAAGGIPEMVRDGETGYLAPVRDVAGLLAGIAWAAGIKNDAKTRLHCRAFALEKWSAPARARDYAALFHALQASGKSDCGGR